MVIKNLNKIQSFPKIPKKMIIIFYLNSPGIFTHQKVLILYYPYRRRIYSLLTQKNYNKLFIFKSKNSQSKWKLIVKNNFILKFHKGKRTNKFINGINQIVSYFISIIKT